MLHRMLLNVPRDNRRLVKKTEEMWGFGVTRHNPSPSASYPRNFMIPVT